ncbi:heavy-metal-associated domain-containing protein [Pseudonocardia kongjuensis]|uniref:Heavy-metal-associated domain-containing protein n=1 Tax=Pseudonocardia kongjuensis TaxID=102227 RepID=A0ABN1XGU1_9PSEU
MSTATYTVSGMTCGHCVSSVTEEISEVAGVTDVSVDLPTGAVTVTGDGEISSDAVRAAVQEAGYEITSGA